MVETFLNGLTKENLVSVLTNSSVVRVRFTKADGSVRVLQGTCNLDLLRRLSEKDANVGEVAEPTGPVGDSMPIYDTELKGWRSFRFDRLTDIEVVVP